MPQSDGKNKLKRMEFEFQGKSFEFNVNPEEYTQDEPSRSMVTQTKGGAWIDDFGGGLTTIFIKGTTGFQNGFKKIQELKELIRKYKKNIKPGETVVDELTFHNYTDDESFIVHLDPSGLKLFRSKSNPLLFMYEIRLVCLRGAQEPAPGLVKKSGVTKQSFDPKKAATEVSKLLGGTARPISDAFGVTMNELQILNNGVVPAEGTKLGAQSMSRMSFFASSDASGVTPELDPKVSSLALDYHRKFVARLIPTSGVPLEQDTFIYRVLYTIPPALLTEQEMDAIRMILLESYAITTAYYHDKNALHTRISQSDVSRVVTNIRWLTAKLGDHDSVALYDIIVGFRDLELYLKQLKNVSSLFAKDISTSLKQFNEAGS